MKTFNTNDQTLIHGTAQVIASSLLAVFASVLFIFVFYMYCKWLRGKADWFVLISVVCLQVSLVIRASVAVLEATHLINSS